MGAIDDIADRYVDQWAQLEPIGATYIGISGFDDKLSDFSPDGFAARADLERHTLAELTPLQPADERERVAKEAMSERLGLALELYDAGMTTSELNVISSPLHAVRSIFDLMPLAGERAAANVAARMAAAPAALERWKTTLRDGVGGLQSSPRPSSLCWKSTPVDASAR